MTITAAAEHHALKWLPAYACQGCGQVTIWHCMECHQPTCVSCSYSQFAMCQPCKAAYHGPIWQLGKRADAYIRAEFHNAFVF